MKKILLALVLSAPAALFAQTTTPDTTAKQHRDMLSLDATYFLRQFIGNGNSSYGSPYIIGYRRWYGNNALRVHLGGSLSSVFNDSFSGNGRYNAAVAVGYERHVPIINHWSFYYGADLVYNHNYAGGMFMNSTWQPMNVRTHEAGIAPLLGVVYSINSRMSLATETNFQLLYSTTHYKGGYGDWRRSGISTKFIPPVSLSFRFTL